MPLINGQKMACEPCIRGHRSTKCTHANERLMVPVRKPGRPLSSCPHPASRPCSCAAVTAAIPKKQQCHCGTSSSGDDKTDKDASSAGATPPSPSKAAAPSSYRVQKSSSKNGPSRKPFDPAGLERMDASHLNILPPFDTGQRKSTPAPIMAPMLSMPGYGAMGFMPPGNSFGPEPTLFPLFQPPPPMPSPITNPTISKPATNGHYSPQVNGMIGSSAAPTPGSCCGGGKVTQPRQPPKTNGVKQHKPKSCCSSGTASPETESETEPLPLPAVHPQANGMMMPAFPGPVAMPNGMFPFFPQPTVFAYPPHYGSYLQPLQPEQWRQLMTTLNYGNSIPNPAYSVPATVSFSCHPSTVNGGSWTSHQCSCGESCQCVGCATHPYNQATQNYVRSAWTTMMEDAQKQQDHANGNHSLANGNHDRSSNQTPNSVATPVRNHTEGTVSPPAAQTPSDAASGVGEEQTLSGDDYFFVSYPFDSCEGEMASCPCGDDCQCIGCAIHNPDLVQPSEEHPSL